MRKGAFDERGDVLGIGNARLCPGAHAGERAGGQPPPQRIGQARSGREGGGEGAREAVARGNGVDDRDLRRLEALPQATLPAYDAGRPQGRDARDAPFRIEPPDEAQREHLITTYKELRPNATPDDLAVGIWSDALHIASTRLVERKQALGGDGPVGNETPPDESGGIGDVAPVYMYYFAWESPAEGGKLKAIELDEPWAVRQWNICVQDGQSLPSPVKLLLKHLTKDAA